MTETETLSWGLKLQLRDQTPVQVISTYKKPTQAPKHAHAHTPPSKPKRGKRPRDVSKEIRSAMYATSFIIAY